MAFDFLGNPTEEEFNEFEVFVSEEIQRFDRKSKHLKAELVRLKIIRDRLIKEFKARGLTLPTDYDGDPGNPDISSSEVIRFDAPIAYKVSKAKKPFIDTIKYERERLENSLKRNYYLISKINEKLLEITSNKEDLLSNLNAAKAILSESNLFKKDTNEVS